MISNHLSITDANGILQRKVETFYTALNMNFILYKIQTIVNKFITNNDQLKAYFIVGLLPDVIQTPANVFECILFEINSPLPYKKYGFQSKEEHKRKMTWKD